MGKVQQTLKNRHLWIIPAAISATLFAAAASPQEEPARTMTNAITVAASSIISPVAEPVPFSHGKAQPWNRCRIPVQVNLAGAPPGFADTVQQAVQQVNNVTWVRYGPVTLTDRPHYTPSTAAPDDAVLIAADEYLAARAAHDPLLRPQSC